MVDVPEIVPEEPAGSQEQFPLDDLASEQEALDYVLDDDLLLHCPELQAGDFVVEAALHFENLLHRVHHRPAEDEAAARIL